MATGRHSMGGINGMSLSVVRVIRRVTGWWGWQHSRLEVQPNSHHCFVDSPLLYRPSTPSSPRHYTGAASPPGVEPGHPVTTSVRNPVDEVSPASGCVSAPSIHWGLL